MSNTLASPPPRFAFGDRVEAVTAHGGLWRRRIQPWERGVIIDSAHDGANYRVAWPGGRRTTSYPWHLQLVGETVFYTADVVAVHVDEHGEPWVLLVRRSDDNDAYPGFWALPGGHVERRELSCLAAARELREESGVDVAPDRLTQIGAYDEPLRDARGRYVTVAYLAVLPHRPTSAAESDASDARWRRARDVHGLAFDHDRILADALAALPPVAELGAGTVQESC